MKVVLFGEATGGGKGVGVKFQVLSISPTFCFVVDQMAFRMTKDALKSKLGSNSNTSNLPKVLRYPRKRAAATQ